MTKKKTYKVKGLTGTKDQPPKRIWDKYPCRIAYRWDGFIVGTGERMKTTDDYNPLDEPKFMTWKTSKPFEPWPLELIRRKFFVDLKDAHNWERDLWMPKVVTLMQYIWEREMVSVYEMEKFLGMPHKYLWGLCQRDTNFRRWIGWCRSKNLQHKGLEAIESKAHGQSSILQLIKPHSNGVKKFEEFKFNIDVGWTPRSYARRLSKRQREVEAYKEREKQTLPKPKEYPL